MYYTPISMKYQYIALIVLFLYLLRSIFYSNHNSGIKTLNLNYKLLNWCALEFLFLVKNN